MYEAEELALALRAYDIDGQVIATLYNPYKNTYAWLNSQLNIASDASNALLSLLCSYDDQALDIVKARNMAVKIIQNDNHEFIDNWSLQKRRHDALYALNFTKEVKFMIDSEGIVRPFESAKLLEKDLIAQSKLPVRR